MNKFNWENFKVYDIAVTFSNRDEFEHFVKEAKQNGIHFYENTNINEDYKELSFAVHSDSKGCMYKEFIEYFTHDFRIVKWSDYMEKEFELKEGMLLVLGDNIGQIWEEASGDKRIDIYEIVETVRLEDHKHKIKQVFCKDESFNGFKKELSLREAEELLSEKFGYQVKIIS